MFWPGALALVNPMEGQYTSMMYAATAIAVILWVSLIFLPIFAVSLVPYSYYYCTYLHVWWAYSLYSDKIYPTRSWVKKIDFVKMKKGSQSYL